MLFFSGEFTTIWILRLYIVFQFSTNKIRQLHEEIMQI